MRGGEKPASRTSIPYMLGDMAQAFLPGDRKSPDYEMKRILGFRAGAVIHYRAGGLDRAMRAWNVPAPRKRWDSALHHGDKSPDGRFTPYVSAYHRAILFSGYLVRAALIGDRSSTLLSGSDQRGMSPPGALISDPSRS